MRKIVSLIVSLLALAAAIYIVTMVPMGDKTLWQHLKSIADTTESKQMVEGVKKTAHDVIERATKKAEPKKGKDDLTREDRKRLRKLLKKLDQDEEAEEQEGKAGEDKTPKEAEKK